MRAQNVDLVETELFHYKVELHYIVRKGSKCAHNVHLVWREARVRENRRVQPFRKQQ